VLVENVIKKWSKSPQQDLTRAEQLLLEALERDRKDPRAYYAIGMLRRQQARWTESRIALEMAIALDRNYASAHLQLGYTLNGLGEPETALPYFEKALQLNPQHQNIFYFYSGLGFCHLLLGHVDQAIDFLTKARATGSQVYYIPLGLAAALGMHGDIDEAKAALTEFLRLKPELDSLAKVRATWPTPSPRAAALAEKTWVVGLRRAGLPEE
jgi:tetratricopeptide (TPR) repeat protein